MRGSGKTTCLGGLMRGVHHPFHCDFEDTRLSGFGPAHFPAFLAALDELVGPGTALYLDGIGAVRQWQQLIRTLLDRGHPVCAAGADGSPADLGSESGLADRFTWVELTPFSYAEHLGFTGAPAGTRSLGAYLDGGGFPAFLHERRAAVLQGILRDALWRDVATRHALRHTWHPMHLLLFLLSHTGVPLSFQALTKKLAIPTVGQTSRYVALIEDARLLFAVPRLGGAPGRRVVAPPKYYTVDNGLRRAAPSPADPGADRLGSRLENAVALHLRRQTVDIGYAVERDLWECDFVTPDSVIQVCPELTAANRDRELRGVIEAARLPGKRRAVVVTLDQETRLHEGGLAIEVVPAWRWMHPGAPAAESATRPSRPQPRPQTRTRPQPRPRARPRLVAPPEPSVHVLEVLPDHLL